MAHSKFTVGEINAVIGDNSEHQVHRAGYNGVWELRHRSSTRNLFVPAYAGLNLGLHVGDDPAAVVRNRDVLNAMLSLSAEPAWLEQIHATDIADLDAYAIAPGSYS